jgi:hypothetical protein
MIANVSQKDANARRKQETNRKLKKKRNIMKKG